MAKPDIAGMEREKASMYVQRILRKEQNELPPGYGIWFNWYCYPELRRNYLSQPVMYKLNPWGPFNPEGWVKKKVQIIRRLRKRGILGIRITGPIEQSPQAYHVREYERTRNIEDERRLIEEWRATRMQPHLNRWGLPGNLNF